MHKHKSKPEPEPRAKCLSAQVPCAKIAKCSSAMCHARARVSGLVQKPKPKPKPTTIPLFITDYVMTQVHILLTYIFLVFF